MSRLISKCGLQNTEYGKPWPLTHTFQRISFPKHMEISIDTKKKLSRNRYNYLYNFVGVLYTFAAAYIFSLIQVVC